MVPFVSDWLYPRHWVFFLLENLIVPQLLIKNCPICMELERSCSAFTTGLLSLAWARRIHSNSTIPLPFRYMLTLSYHPCLGLPICLFNSGFFYQALCVEFWRSQHTVRICGRGGGVIIYIVRCEHCCSTCGISPKKCVQLLGEILQPDPLDCWLIIQRRYWLSPKLFSEFLFVNVDHKTKWRSWRN